ncbi:MAG TPA: hypothetical protein VJY35_10420, partial [Candidatus Eisenbacteria bacterium]|nr:hypothetical protein [Candidatus Eisenbacteria bacterium]
ARGTAPPVTVRIVTLGGRAVPRAEVRVTTALGRPRDVHLYECYWAPVTEGKVTTAEALWFLVGSGFRGMQHCEFRRWWFERYLFERPIRFDIPKHVLLQFVAALTLIGSLLVINAIMVTVLASRTLAGGGGRWPSDALLADLTCDLFLGLAAMGASVAGAMLLPEAVRRWFRRTPSDRPRRLPDWVTGLSWALMVGALASIVAIAWTLVAHAWHHMSPGEPRQVHVWPLEAVFAGFGSGPWTWYQWVIVLATWAGGGVVNWQVRRFLLQYVGDVAAYVSSHTVSRFNEVRDQIQARSLEIARAVYRAPAPSGEGFLYPGVVMVGHSLGSVVAYDALNALLVDESLSDRPLSVAERTRMLLTFGSPLDKTAFIYRAQQLRPTGAREALAAARQPMILDYRRRPARWVNLHSRHDWISGSLQYYDDTDQREERDRWVENLEDPEATTPLAAHVEYWHGRLLADRLYEGVTG